MMVEFGSPPTLDFFRETGTLTYRKEDSRLCTVS